MSISALFRPVPHPEIIIGLVAPLGTPLPGIVSAVSDILSKFDYSTETLRLSDYTNAFDDTEPQEYASEFERIISKMKSGSDLRKELGGDVLACIACATIHAKRPATESRLFENKAFVLRQLKHPAEVDLLRKVYGTAFHLIGVACPESLRESALRANCGFSAKQAKQLIEIDNSEEREALGQQVVKTFYKSDFFIEIRSLDDASNSVFTQLERYFDLLFGAKIISPSKDEYGLYLAKSASLRSTDLSRQVGASILSPYGDIIALGANEVPAPLGGQYWDGDGDGDEDARDFVRGFDANERMRRESLKEVLSAVLNIDVDEELLDTYCQDLKNTRLMSLTEFGRATHAEMEAILSASRNSGSTRGAHLYSTTFPCHNCTKHIVGAGIKRVVYVEPYEKSLALELHGDAVEFNPISSSDKRVTFVAFSGVSPRRYSLLFSNFSDSEEQMVRKDPRGNHVPEPARLRLLGAPLTHVDKEAITCEFIKQLEETNRVQHGREKRSKRKE